MPNLYGANSVRSEQKRLNNVFSLIDGTDLNDEARSHYARYLCIRLAGFAEQSLKNLVTVHARNKSAPSIHRFVELQMAKLWGINQDKLRRTLDELNPDWWRDLLKKLPDEVDALQSVGKLRDRISHGGNDSITIPTVQQYKESVFCLISYLCDLLDPPPQGQ